MSVNAKLNKLTNTDKALETCRKLANDFIQRNVVALSSAEQRESYEIYAKNLPDQVYAFLCHRFFEGKESVSFYATAINAMLWMTTQKIYDKSKNNDLLNAIDKLLFSCRHRSDYKRIFELVHANKTSYLNQWSEMINAAGKSDVKQKDAFIDCFITLITRINADKVKNVSKDFNARNLNVFEYIIASMEPAAFLKLIPYLEKQKEQNFLMEKYYYHAFVNNKNRNSMAHLAVAGDLASKYISDLKQNKKLFAAYKKLFLDGIPSKEDDVSLLSADYYFRITTAEDKAVIERGRKEFASRWPNMRPISGKVTKK